MQVTFRYKRLKEERIKKNMTQEMLAECCNTSDRYIRDLERGRKTHPSAEMVYLLASTLEIPMTELMSVQPEDAL